MSNRLHILITEPSIIIRSGLVSVFRRLSSLDLEIAESGDVVNIQEQIRRYNPDVLIVDPSYVGQLFMSRFRNEWRYSDVKVVALLNSLRDKNMLSDYDAVISLYDTPDTIKEALESLHIKKSGEECEKQELSPREKEIVVCVVKGMTNKQMADELCLSTHTIMTHRRNISSKLQIHSPAGLTIYAIVNKLVDINDVKNTILSDDL